MTLDEAIKHAEEAAEEYQRVVDTGIVFDDVTIDMMYCDDTEVIEEHLANYQKRAEEYRQLAEWLKDYKRLLEQQPSEDAISRAETVKFLANHSNEYEDVRVRIAFQSASSLVNNPHNLPPVQPQPKTGYWEWVQYNHFPALGNWHCSECRCVIVECARKENKKNVQGYKYCPNCGAKMQEV